MSSTSTTILRLARTIVSSAKDSRQQLPFRKLANALGPSGSQVLAQNTPRVPTVSDTDDDNNADDNKLKSLLESIESPLHALWKRQQKEGAKIQQYNSNSTYGETPPRTMRTLLSIIQHEHGRFDGDFVDVGSGNGAATISAALTGHFQSVKGIEYEESRHQAALLLEKAYSSSSPASSSVEFRNGDICKEANILNNASVVFCNSVTWNAQLSGDMGLLLEKQTLESPAIVVSISRRFPCPSMNLVNILKLPCNGGEDFVFYICQKVDDSNKDSSGNILLNSAAVSDSLEMTCLIKEDKVLKNLIEATINSICSFPLSNDDDDDNNNNKHDRMAVLAALGTSESGTRIMLQNEDFLEMLAGELDIVKSDLPSRASSSIVLRAISTFPVGQRAIANNGFVLDTLLSSLSIDSLSKDHPAVRANALDILGQVLNDPIGYQVVKNHPTYEVQDMLQENMSVAREQNWKEVMEAALEVQVMMRWWQGEQRALGGGFTFHVLRSD